MSRLQVYAALEAARGRAMKPKCIPVIDPVIDNEPTTFDDAVTRLQDVREFSRQQQAIIDSLQTQLLKWEALFGAIDFATPTTQADR